MIAKTSPIRRAAELALLTAVVVAALTAHAPRTVAQEQPSAGTGLETLSDCVKTTRKLAVVLLVDESGSLRSTDPNGGRVAALKTAIEGLGLLASSSADNAPQIDVKVAGFSVGFNDYGDWVRLTRDNASEIAGRTDDFRSRDQGMDTDYYAAISGARDELSKKAAELTSEGGDVCTAVLLFTDGGYDIEDNRGSLPTTKSYAPNVRLGSPGSGTALVQAGEALLCDRGGLFDQMRSDHTVILAVGFGLRSDTPPNDRDQKNDAGFLQSMVTGSGPGVDACGEPSSSQWGQFLPAGDLSELVRRFFEIVNWPPTSVGGEEKYPVCAGKPCEQGRRSFEVDPSLRRFTILAQADAPGIDLYLQSPEVTEPLRLQPSSRGTDRLGSAEVRHTAVSDRDMLIEVLLDPMTSGWAGTWSLTFVDPDGQHPNAVGRSKINVFGSLEPRISDSTLELGSPGTVRVEAVTAAGLPAAPSGFLRDATMSVTITDPITGKSVKPELKSQGPIGPWELSYTPPRDLTAAAVDVAANLEVTTTSGVKLAGTRVTKSVVVNPPKAFYARVAPTPLRLPSIDGEGSTAGKVVVTGPERGTSKVCVNGQTSSAKPASMPSVNVNKGQCVDVGAGATTDLPVTITPAGVGTGVLRGAVDVQVFPTENTQPPVVRSVPYSFQALAPVDTGTRWWIVILAMSLGLLVPALLFVLISWLITRFGNRDCFQYCRVEVAVSAHDVRRLSPVKRRTGPDAAQGELVELTDLAPLGGRGGKSFSMEGVTVRARMRRLGLLSSEAELSDGSSTAIGALGTRGTVNARLPLALNGSWAFLLESVDVAAGPAPATSDELSSQAGSPSANDFEVRGWLYLIIDDLIGWDARLADQLPALAGDLQASTEPVRARAAKSHAEAMAPVATSTAGGPSSTTSMSVEDLLGGGDGDDDELAVGNLLGGKDPTATSVPVEDLLGGDDEGDNEFAVDSLLGGDESSSADADGDGLDDTSFNDDVDESPITYAADADEGSGGSTGQAGQGDNELGVDDLL